MYYLNDAFNSIIELLKCPFVDCTKGTLEKEIGIECVLLDKMDSN